MAKEEATLVLRIKQIGGATLNKVKQGLKSVGVAAVALGGALTGLVSKSLQAFQKQEDAVNRLNQSLVSSGQFTREASRQMQNFASSLQQTTKFGDEVILNQLALAKNFGLTNDQAQDLVRAATDLSAATGMSLDSAVKNLGKTFSGLTGELGEALPQIRGLTAEQLKAGAAVEVVANSFRGFAESEARTLSGSIAQAENSFGDLLEVIGKEAAPIVAGIANRIKNFTNALQTNSSAIRAMRAAIDGLFKAGIVLKFAFEQVGETLGTVFGTLFVAVQQAAEGNFAQAMESIKSGIRGVKEDTISNVTELNEQLDEIDENRRAAQIEKDTLRNQEDLTRQSAQNAKLLENQKQFHKQDLNEQQKKDAQKRLEALKMAQFHELINSQRVKNMQSTFGQIQTLSQSNNKALVAIGKAAGIANAIINTAQGVTLALSTFPWPLSFAIAGLVAAAGAVQVATIAGVGLAEGGIVKATPGGVPAIIGEGGKDEAVIPLDDDITSLQPQVTINFTGAFLGDEATAREFARVIDKQLLELRRDNESESFDSGII